MQVFDVAPGIFWVEVPSANLRVLCGCPADAIKHLMRRGLVKRAEKGGVTFEVGPNAILLSDVALQGGEFCNLAEFPVLHMLYRQGMILPGHPNNTGRRPILIGMRNQVRAQLEYIHRGNYGLISEEELIASGATPEQARDWMRLKLRFAFGSIRAPEQLLETRILDQQSLPIRGGVHVRRLDMNVFEFRHGDQRAVVDLNLSSGQRYIPPYQLGHHNLRRDYFSIVHSGEGDGWDVNRPTMSSVIMFQGKVFLVDAGPNLQSVMSALGIGIHEVEGIFHTHCHDDHFAGLTTLMRSDRRIRYYATSTVRASVTKKLSALLNVEGANFEHFFDPHDLVLGQWNDIEGLEVLPMFSPHPVETTVMHFRTIWEEGYRSFGHMADIASFRVLDQMTTEDDLAPGISKAAADKVKQDYLLPVDVKKLDIGGGLIHGRAEDFADDQSGKIILTHTAQVLSPSQKEIGSGAPFGTADVLIPALQEYPLRFAHTYLTEYFPEVSQHQIRILLNHSVQTFNPETILIREGRPNDRVFLVLTGLVEVIGDRSDEVATLTAGACLGELSALNDSLPKETARAVSFVRVLALPCSLYRAFLMRNGLEDRVRRMADLRSFFNRTRLLGENLSEIVGTRIAQASEIVTYARGDEIPIVGLDRILVIRKGSVAKRIQGQVVATIGEGDFVGAGESLFGGQALCSYLAVEDVEGVAIPGAILRDIPITRWKLFETYQRRMARMFAPRDDGIAFPWLPDYAVGVPSMDDQHRMLFEMASRIVAAARAGNRQATLDGIGELIEQARQHFKDEEILLKSYSFDGLAEHQRSHRELLADLRREQSRLKTEKEIDAEGFKTFFHGWIVNHIFREDGRYGRMLAEQNRYGN